MLNRGRQSPQEFPGLLSLPARYARKAFRFHAVEEVEATSPCLQDTGVDVRVIVFAPITLTIIPVPWWEAKEADRSITN
jgi:hypothetical protein